MVVFHSSTSRLLELVNRSLFENPNIPCQPLVKFGHFNTIWSFHVAVIIMYIELVIINLRNYWTGCSFVFM